MLKGLALTVVTLTLSVGSALAAPTFVAPLERTTNLDPRRRRPLRQPH